MHSSLFDTPLAAIAGFGSPHGDDQAGWLLIQRLKSYPELSSHVLLVTEPTQLLAALPVKERLIVVDACRSGNAPGTISKLYWPDPRIAVCRSCSSHGLGVAETLELARKFDQLPPCVEVIGIEVADCRPGAEIGEVVLQAVFRLATQLADEFHGAIHA